MSFCVGVWLTLVTVATWLPSLYTNNLTRIELSRLSRTRWAGPSLRSHSRRSGCVTKERATWVVKRLKLSGPATAGRSFNESSMRHTPSAPCARRGHEGVPSRVRVTARGRSHADALPYIVRDRLPSCTSTACDGVSGGAGSGPVSCLSWRHLVRDSGHDRPASGVLPDHRARHRDMDDDGPGFICVILIDPKFGPFTRQALDHIEPRGPNRVASPIGEPARPIPTRPPPFHSRCRS